MLIIPAIDLKDGQCVRLLQGRMEDATVFGSDPVEMATRWVEAGCRRLHLVDLNGAFEGTPIHAEAVTAISKKYPDLPIQIGGGIRSLETIEAYIKAGVSWCIIGTAAVKNPGFVREGRVATEGWADVSDVLATDLARDFANDGVSAIVYTDISRDGMMQGVNVDATVEVAKAGGIPVIASGGVTNMTDIERLCDVASQGVLGAITGRAIYDGAIDVQEAQAYCDGRG